MIGIPIIEDGRVTGVVCTEAMEEVFRRPHGETRWCFVCRQRRDFEYVVIAPVGPSYYGPSPSIQCATCGTSDGDCFPGRYREWEY